MFELNKVDIPKELLGLSNAVKPYLENLQKKQEEAIEKAIKEALALNNIEGDIIELAKNKLLTRHMHEDGLHEILYDSQLILEYWLVTPLPSSHIYLPDNAHFIAGQSLQYRILSL